jgi:transposase InsO family protein
MKFAFVERERQHYPLSLLCRALGVSVSGYYRWCRRRQQGGATPRQVANQQLGAAIRTIHAASYGTYGSPRIHAQLRRAGWSCSKQRVERLMRLHGLCGKHKRRRRPQTTQRQHSWPVAENRLNQAFVAHQPNQKWGADITYIPTAQGWLYLAVILDLFSRKVVGWAMDTTLQTDLVKRALVAALTTRRPDAGLLHHSDRGSQYASQPYQTLLKERQIEVSMSRRGNCYDNAVTESFFATLKVERVNDQRYASPAEAKRDLFRYIEGFYNRCRLHSALGYLSPEQFERCHSQEGLIFPSTVFREDQLASRVTARRDRLR